MINLIDKPILIGIITTILIWCDFILTQIQNREVKKNYQKHYQSYPINTVEGNNFLRKEVEKGNFFNVKHFIISIICGIIIYFVIKTSGGRELYTGFILGLFILVNVQHINNIIGYIASRKGLHGKLYLHLRTGYMIQSARYFSITILLIVISVLTGSELIYGITIAGIFSSIRLLIFMKKAPSLKEDEKLFNECLNEENDIQNTKL
jgi:hypothetical protein